MPAKCHRMRPAATSAEPLTASGCNDASVNVLEPCGRRDLVVLDCGLAVLSRGRGRRNAALRRQFGDNRMLAAVVPGSRRGNIARAALISKTAGDYC